MATSEYEDVKLSICCFLAELVKQGLQPPEYELTFTAGTISIKPRHPHFYVGEKIRQDFAERNPGLGVLVDWLEDSEAAKVEVYAGCLRINTIELTPVELRHYWEWTP